MSIQNDINTFEKMNNMKNMIGGSFIELLKPNIKKKENESVIKMLDINNKPETYLELLAVAIFHQNFEIIKHMVEKFKIVETDAPYMKASSFYNSILPDDSKDKINDSKDYMDVQIPFVIMSGIGGDVEIFKYLLNNKLISDKNQSDVIGLSKKYKNSFTSNIIGACAYYGKKELLDYLLRHYKNELNINIVTTEKKVKNTKFSFTREYSGCTPSLLAMTGTASDSQTLEILKILKNFGANFEVSDSNKDNLLHLATKNKKIECAKYIVDDLNLKNLVNEVNKDKYNPLSLAQHLNNDDFISYYSEKNKIDEKEIEENLKSLIEDSANRSVKQSKKNKKNKKKGKYNKNEKEDKKQEEKNENQSSIEVLKPQTNEINDNNKEEESKKDEEENKKEEDNDKKEDEKEEGETEEIKEKGKKETSKKNTQKNKKNQNQKVENSEQNIPKTEPVEIIGLTTKKSKKLKKYKASIKAKFSEGENNEESNKDKDKDNEKEKEENKKEDIIKEEEKESEIKEPIKEEGEKKPEKSKKISKKEKRIDKNNDEIEKEKKRKEEEQKQRQKELEEEEERKRLEEEEKHKKELEEQRKREEEERKRKREEEERKRKREEKRKKEEERRRLEEEERKRLEEEERKRLEEEERKRREEEEEKEISNSEDNNIDENSSEKDDENEMVNVEITKKDYDDLNHNYLELQKKLEILEKEKKELTSCLTKLYLENKENTKIYPSSNNEENINDLMYLANKELEEKNHIINELEDKKAMLDLTNIQNFSNEKLKKYKEFYQKNLEIIDDALKKS